MADASACVRAQQGLPGLAAQEFVSMDDNTGLASPIVP
jgi:hypothetical protein